MNDSQGFIKKWNKYRGYGKLKYILIYGILIDNLIAISLFAVIMPLVKNNFNIEYYSSPSFITNIIIWFAVATLMGFITSYAQWNRNEYRYDSIMKNNTKL